MQPDTARTAPRAERRLRSAEARGIPPREGTILYGARAAVADPCVL